MINISDSLALFVDMQERMMPAINNHEEVIRRACILARGARLLGLPVLAARQYPKGLGETVAPLLEALGEHDVTDKTAFSCLGDEILRNKIAAAGRKNVLVAGVESHICVLQTVLDLLEGGYNVYLAADCCGSRKESDRGYAEWRMALAGAKMTTVESVLFELMTHKDHPARKDIQALIK